MIGSERTLDGSTSSRYCGGSVDQSAEEREGK